MTVLLWGRYLRISPGGLFRRSGRTLDLLIRLKHFLGKSGLADCLVSPCELVVQAAVFVGGKRCFEMRYGIPRFPGSQVATRQGFASRD